MCTFEGKLHIEHPFFAKFSLLLCLIVMMSSQSFAYQQTADADTTIMQTDSLSTSESEITQLPFQSSNQFNFIKLITKTSGYLAVIVALIFGLVYLMKKYVYNKKDSGVNAGAVRVISSTFVSPKKSIMMVEAIGRILLVSVTDSNMSLLTEMNKGDYDDFMENAAKEEKDSKTAVSFTEMFSNILNRSGS